METVSAFRNTYTAENVTNSEEAQSTSTSDNTGSMSSFYLTTTLNTQFASSDSDVTSIDLDGATITESILQSVETGLFSTVLTTNQYISVSQISTISQSSAATATSTSTGLLHKVGSYIENGFSHISSFLSSIF